MKGTPSINHAQKSDFEYREESNLSDPRGLCSTHNNPLKKPNQENTSREEEFRFIVSIIQRTQQEQRMEIGVEMFSWCISR
jgi:hypothetical protein